MLWMVLSWFRGQIALCNSLFVLKSATCLEGGHCNLFNTSVTELVWW